MFVKRGSAEDVYAVALQRLNARAKAELPEPQSPGAEPHARRDHICDRRPRELRVILSLVVRPPHGPMPNEGIQGDEWGTYVALDTFLSDGTWEGLKDASLTVPEFS